MVLGDQASDGQPGLLRLAGGVEVLDLDLLAFDPAGRVHLVDGEEYAVVGGSAEGRLAAGE